jgi:hypothetical protein
MLKKNAGGYLEWGDAAGGSDNLGNHVATSTLDMAGFGVVNVGSMTIVATTTYASSLWVSTSVVTPHLYVSTMGRVSIGTGDPTERFEVGEAGKNTFKVKPGAGFISIMIDGAEIAKIKP